MPRAKDRPAPYPTNAPAVTPETLPEFTADTHARWLPIAEVRKWDKNPRINAEAIPKVADSIRRFGVVAPAVVWEEAGRLVAGHTRIAALESILAADPTFVPKGASPGVRPGMIPVRFHPFASEAEADAYAIADNRLNEIARWDVPVLHDLLASFGDSSLVALTGFDPSVLTIPSIGATAELAPAATGEDADTIALGGMGAGIAGREHSLRFGALRLVMSENESAELLASVESFKKVNGTYDGFVGYLLARLRS